MQYVYRLIVGLCTALPGMMSLAATDLVPIKLESGLRTERDLISSNGRYFLSISTGIWDNAGYLLDLSTREIYSLEGHTKGRTLNLKSFDAEKGLEYPPEYLMTGTYTPANNQMSAVLTRMPGRQSQKLQFIPFIKTPHIPQYSFKYFGKQGKYGNYDSRITQIQVFDQQQKLIQTLSGFSANTYEVVYADYNYDGYFDLLLNDSKRVGDEPHYQVWRYQPNTGRFIRDEFLNSYNDKHNTSPWRYPHKKQLNMGKGRLLQMVNGYWKTMPCCYPD